MACKTVVAYWLLRMVSARNTHVHLGASKGAKATSVTHVHMHFLLIVKSACVRILTLDVKVSLAVVSHWPLLQRLLLLVRVSLALNWLLLEAGH